MMLVFICLIMATWDDDFAIFCARVLMICPLERVRGLRFYSAHKLKAQLTYSVHAQLSSLSLREGDQKHLNVNCYLVACTACSPGNLNASWFHPENYAANLTEVNFTNLRPCVP